MKAGIIRNQEETVRVLYLLAQEIRSFSSSLKASQKSVRLDGRHLADLRRAIVEANTKETLDLFAGIDFGLEENWEWALGIIGNRHSPHLLIPFLQQRNLNPLDYHAPHRRQSSLFIAIFDELLRDQRPEEQLFKALDGILSENWRTRNLTAFLIGVMRDRLSSDIVDNLKIRSITPDMVHEIITALFDPESSDYNETPLCRTLKYNKTKTIRILDALVSILELASPDPKLRYVRNTFRPVPSHGRFPYDENPQSVFWLLRNWNTLDPDQHGLEFSQGVKARPSMRHRLLRLLLEKSSQPYLLASAGGWITPVDEDKQRLSKIPVDNPLVFVLPALPEIYDQPEKNQQITPVGKTEQLIIAKELMQYGVNPLFTSLSREEGKRVTVAERLYREDRTDFLHDLLGPYWEEMMNEVRLLDNSEWEEVRQSGKVNEWIESWGVRHESQKKQAVVDHCHEDTGMGLPANVYCDAGTEEWEYIQQVCVKQRTADRATAVEASWTDWEETVADDRISHHGSSKVSKPRTETEKGCSTAVDCDWFSADWSDWSDDETVVDGDREAVDSEADWFSAAWSDDETVVDEDLLGTTSTSAISLNGTRLQEGERISGSSGSNGFTTAKNMTLADVWDDAWSDAETVVDEDEMGAGAEISTGPKEKPMQGSWASSEGSNISFVSFARKKALGSTGSKMQCRRRRPFRFHVD
ncbi:hypothetical protein BJ508DRAFT_364247 [Ascobolus immersus RN42]|uniref:Uncharacterized protein n=1 Tax=Ascobolus immersus RN42 TaxID=1160509 RepID=A0A3N4HX97_ASCIM|nr:hypothetical protein BJ508DRAFT_364247 [Ascobolus immersus RN42]